MRTGPTFLIASLRPSSLIPLFLYTVFRLEEEVYGKVWWGWGGESELEKEADAVLAASSSG